MAHSLNKNDDATSAVFPSKDTVTIAGKRNLTVSVLLAVTTLIATILAVAVTGSSNRTNSSSAYSSSSNPLC